ncbi:paraquat-inducible protein A [Spongiibacter sp. KMU-158]|uniref:Paraquat-inducible protein A n=1 Tax=Spongiibacter pelagi TaxID=2760804 RepID=A0A927GWI1_9GAMM|nr:paraquat-inducible protein A [Spongiibacter pelagi]MBD2859771.1 paraquat-inducible protein A [Spongiibacter pelagi]
MSHSPSDITPPAASHWVACQDCDQLLQTAVLSEHQRARCPRCGARLEGVAVKSLHRYPGLAAAIAGLILFFPAISLPIMEFELIGQHGTNTLWEGVWTLWQVGFPLLAMLVLLCSLLAPLCHLLLSIRTSWQLGSEKTLPPSFPQQLKALHFFQHWSMVEVYAISILVAYIKLLSDGEVMLLSGSYCIAALLICLIVTSQQSHAETAWQAWEAQQKRRPI